MIEPTRVLVVDDAPGVRNLLRIILPDLGFEITAEAGNGSEGIEKAVVEQPDVVILDLHMPDMDGLEALPKIREGAPSCKIVIYTSDDDVAMRDRVLAQGADAYVGKSGTIEDVEVALKRVLNGGG